MRHGQTVPKLENILQGAQLPALPQSAIRLLELSQNPNNGPPEFAAPVEADPGLTGQVLKFVNSSYFGFSQEITSVKLAITLVGIRTIKNFALWSAVFSLMPNPKCGPFDLKFLWQDSLRRGIFSRIMGKRLRLSEAEELFAASLLQDMAIPLLAKELPAVYLELLQGRQGGATRLSDLEREAFGWTHAQAAGLMARSWRLPESFTVLLEQHTSLEQLTNSAAALRGSAIVALSSLLPSTCDENWHDRSQFLAAFERMGGQEAELVSLLSRVDDEFAEFAPVLKLSTTARSLASFVAAEEGVPQP